MIKVAIVDDHTMFRKGLASLISGWNDIEIKIEASSGIEFLEMLNKTPVDVVLLDLQMPIMNGLETCEILKKKFPDIKILMLTFLVSPAEILKSLKIGANGYFTKDSQPQELQSAIKKLNAGGFYFNNSLEEIVNNILLNKKTQLKINKQIDISIRELEITKYYALGYNGKEIADKLNISLRTIESHKKNLMEKTNSKNFISVIVYAFVNELITLSEMT